MPAGGLALAGEKPLFSAVKAGYDGNADDDLDDAGDNLAVNETFGSTTITPTYDANGNLTFDGTYKYTYDVWNRLVKVTLDDPHVVIQQARYDGLGRRVRKIVTNAGELDGTTVYHWDNQQIVETRDGSGNVETQVYHGTRYIDEVISQRLPHGRVYVHQDANWNVTALTDLTGRVLERNWYSPYGELEVSHEAHFFDFDADGDVDDDDLAAADTNGVCRDNYAGAGGDCKRLDADADGDVDSSDYDVLSSAFAVISNALQRIPTHQRSRISNVLTRQGLELDPETGLLHNRFRAYHPHSERYLQRDPLGMRPVPGSGYDHGVNLYEYLAGQPLVNVDPYGLSPCTDRCTGCRGDNIFCGCMHRCRQADCILGMVECFSPGAAVGQAVVECMAACLPTVFLPGWVVAYKVCCEGCAGAQTIAQLIVAGECMDQSAFCGNSASDAYDNCMGE